MLEEGELEELKSRLEDEFSDYYEIAGGQNYRYRHLLTTRKLVLKMMQQPGIEDKDFDEKVVEISALFHDIGRKEDINDGFLDPMETHEGHDETGEKIVAEYVQDFVDSEQLEKIERVVGNHHSEAEFVEGKIVQDADDLSNFGVNNLWRSIHYSSDYERTLQEAIDYFWNQQIDQYQEKIDQMYFDFTKQKAEQRLQRLKDTMSDIEEEINAEDL